jgi:transposase
MWMKVASMNKARSPMGKKVFGFVSGKKFCRMNIVAGYANGKSIGECVYAGAMDAQFFNAWVEQFLVHALKSRQVVAMDNASFHKRQNIASAGYSLLLLPPYSPDLNPIENFWANF